MENIFQEAVQLHRAGQFDQAEEKYRKLLAAGQTAPDLYYMYGLLNLHKGAEKEGIELIRQAIQSAPRQANFYIGLYGYFKEKGMFGDALNLLDEMISECGVTPDTLLEKATLLKQENKHAERAECYKQLIELVPATPPLLYNLGNAYKDAGQYEDAQNAYSAAIEIKPDFPEALTNIGICLEQCDKLDEAIMAFKKSNALRPNHALTLASLAQNLLRKNELPEAYVYSQNALDIQADNLSALKCLIECKFKLNLLDDVVELSDRILALDPDDMTGLFYRASVLCHTGNTQEGISIFKKICKQSRSGLISSALTGIIFYHKGKPDKEIDDIFNQAIKLAEETDFALKYTGLEATYFAIFNYFERKSNYDKAFKWLKLANDTHRQTFSYRSETDNKKVQKIEKLFTGENIAKYRDCGHHDSAPIFVLGMPRSGTTLVEQILASHSRVKGCGEPGFMPNIYDQMHIEDEFERSNNWQPILQSVGQKYVSQLKTKFGDGPYLVDKNPGNFLYLGLIALALPDAKIIHCQRSPLETCISIYKQMFYGFQGYAYDLQELGSYYRYYQRLMNHWSSLLGNRIFHIEYESVIENNEREVGRLLDFCGLEFESSCIKFHENKNPVFTASASQVKQPIYKTSLKMSENYGAHFDPLVKALGL